jgi:hypothetical protein
VLGELTTVHEFPFQCSIKVWALGKLFEYDPTAQQSDSETHVVASRFCGTSLGAGRIDQLDPDALATPPMLGPALKGKVLAHWPPMSSVPLGVASAKLIIASATAVKHRVKATKIRGLSGVPCADDIFLPSSPEKAGNIFVFNGGKYQTSGQILSGHCENTRRAKENAQEREKHHTD